MIEKVWRQGAFELVSTHEIASLRTARPHFHQLSKDPRHSQTVALPGFVIVKWRIIGEVVQHARVIRQFLDVLRLGNDADKKWSVAHLAGDASQHRHTIIDRKFTRPKRQIARYPVMKPRRRLRYPAFYITIRNSHHPPTAQMKFAAMSL